MLPGRRPAPARRREASADAVEHDRAARTARACSRGCRRCWVYFVHSYAPDDLDRRGRQRVTTAALSSPRSSAATCAAMQFHPEKSGTNGLQVLANFVARCAARDRRSTCIPRSISAAGGACGCYQGDFDRETVYGDDPVSVARPFDGGRRPLDPRRGPRRGAQRRRIEPSRRGAIAAAVDVPVQTGGGVRDGAAACSTPASRGWWWAPRPSRTRIWCGRSRRSTGPGRGRPRRCFHPGATGG